MEPSEKPIGAPAAPAAGIEDLKPRSSFPLFPVSSNPSSSTSGGPQWLFNPSFALDPSSLPSAPAPAPILQDSDSDSDDTAPPAPPPPSYSLVPSSPSQSSPDEEERRRRRKLRKRKRERREGDGDLRKSSVRAWAGLEIKPAKDYYFDSHGDRDNLAFGALYKMDVARYKVHSYSDSAMANVRFLYRHRHFDSLAELDVDPDGLESKVRAGGRYWSVKYAALERQKNLKHVKIVREKGPVIVPGEYVPVVEKQDLPEKGRNGSVANREVEESWEDELLRKTKEFNKMSREFPHDEKVWLAFAEFQDKVASTQPQNAARLQMLEKKICILEKAVELNPDNEELLLCLLKSYQGRDSTDALMDRWEKTLMQHSDSCRLWKEFLLLRQGEFSRFKVSDMRKTYAYAIQALSSACNKLCRQGHLNSVLESSDPALVQLELGLVDIFINLCRFEWQTGHHELATGLLQAEIEFSLFCPSLLLSPQSKLRLFEHFWNSGGARVGEDGAVGWSTWLEKEEKNRETLVTEESVEETEVGGWTGWFDPLAAKSSAEPDKSAELGEGEEVADENLESEDALPKDDIDTLLRNLGINVDAEPHSEVQDAKTWNRWSVEELSRDHEQWMPVRGHSGDYGNSSSLHFDGNLDNEGHEQLSRVIEFEDVNEYIFSLSSDEARFSLVSQFINIYGGKISRWTCTNNSSWIEKLFSLEILPDSVFEVNQHFEPVNGSKNCLKHLNMDPLLDGKNDSSRSTVMMKFLRNAILLCLNFFPRNYILEEAALSAEELLMAEKESSTGSVNPSRGLAKSLLKNDRQDLLLCGIYARSEASFGNIDFARKIFDMALSAIDGLPPELQESIPILYFWYAEMEMRKSTSWSSSDLCSQRAIHILSCLGGNVKYTPFKCQTSGLQILKARQGFKEQIKRLRSKWARGDVKDHAVALICAASLLEILISGYPTGAEVIEESFSMSLPERRTRSLQLESLWVYYLGMLQKHLKQLKFSEVWESIQHGLELYPYNPELFNTMLEVSNLLTVPHKVRRLFDEYSQRKPSVILCLFALSFELSKAGSQHRIHAIFERALANDKLQKSVLLWRCYLAYEVDVLHVPEAARRVFFRAIHSCPWSKRLWLDGFQKLSSILTTKELSDLHEVMQDKELNLRTDIYEILLQDEAAV